MNDQTPESEAGPLPLPETPDLEWLRKQAKRRLKEMHQSNSVAKLADAQFDIARKHGFPSWRALKAHIDLLTVEGQLFEAARSGDINTLTGLIDKRPELIRATKKPYDWTLLHVAAHNGHLAIVDRLLHLGLDVNTRERGDNTCAMHWAAAAAHIDVVRRLADAGGDVTGHGDDHALEVIGWATCWDGCDDVPHRAVADFLVSRGARHHIFSAIALRLGDAVRRIVAADPAQLERRMSHNEDFQRPLHFAVRMNRPQMVALLLELGADPLGTDASGYPAAAYANAPDVDRTVMEMIRAQGKMDLVTALVVRDWDAADRLLSNGGDSGGALHLMAKRNDVPALKWLLDHGVNSNTRWSHWSAMVTPLHLAAWQGHAEVVRLLLEHGADPNIHDSVHDSDAMGWAEHSGHLEIVRILTEHKTKC